MSRDQGHLFVVHGRIGDVVDDATIIPTGREFWFDPQWRALVGARPARPEHWSRDGWGRLPDAPVRAWAVSVGSHWSDPYALILERIGECLSDICRAGADQSPARGSGTRQIVTLPVVGIGLGGFGDDRGAVVRDLVDRLARLAVDHDVDIALLTPDPAVHAAAQYARREHPLPLPKEFETFAQDLGRQARAGELALFMGAGVGIPAGLPSWHDLVAALAREFAVDLGPARPPLTVTDEAELIEMAAAGRFQSTIVSSVAKHPRPSLLHALLAGLDCREVVTTNYDLLYEKAVRATGREIISVMPWASAHGAERWVLKLHGDVDHPEKIVLTRRHMVRYDASNRPSGALLQSLLLTKRILIVGASMSDDNVVRLAHEVEAYRAENQTGARPPIGTMLDVGGDPVRKRLWEGQLDWLMLGESGIAGPRAIELFLDRVGFHAARDSSWLLDERFSGLLDDPDDRALAERVRELYDALSPARPETKWKPLIEQLQRLGARPPHEP
jgi:hypothetical protein